MNAHVAWQHEWYLFTCLWSVRTRPAPRVSQGRCESMRNCRVLAVQYSIAFFYRYFFSTSLFYLIEKLWFFIDFEMFWFENETKLSASPWAYCSGEIFLQKNIYTNTHNAKRKMKYLWQVARRKIARTFFETYLCNSPINRGCEA